MVYDGKYTFLKELGAGGFGRVFLAEAMVSGRKVAIKQLTETNPTRQDSIIHEIRTISELSHKNQHIVAFFHHFKQDGALFLVMEYCDGGSLRQRLRSKNYELGDVLNWAITLTDTLAWIHKQGVVHNDIKPDNILLTHDGTLKISDFGMANLPGGTRSYLPPNWVNGFGKDPRLDVYSLGVTLLELSNGQNPFALQSPTQIAEIIDQGKLPVHNLPSWQQSLFLKAIQSNAELRFQSMTEFGDAIRAKHVPLIISHHALEAAVILSRAQALILKKRWKDIETITHHIDAKFPENVPLLKIAGQYNLYRNRPLKARNYLEKALLLNNRLDVQKELGWINLEESNYPKAISLLSDHLHRNPGDYEAYNLLLRAYIETRRYETAAELSNLLVKHASDYPCFLNNYCISLALVDIKKGLAALNVHPHGTSPFIDYNRSVLLEKMLTYEYGKIPTLQSKLLFQEFRFGKGSKINSNLSMLGEIPVSETTLQQSIISIGRKGYNQNDITLTGRNVSRRHCLIENIKDDVWVVDLASTGTYVDGERIKKRVQLTGRHVLGIDNYQFEINIDKRRLL